MEYKCKRLIRAALQKAESKHKQTVRQAESAADTEQQTPEKYAQTVVSEKAAQAAENLQSKALDTGRISYRQFRILQERRQRVPTAHAAQPAETENAPLAQSADKRETFKRQRFRQRALDKQEIKTPDSYRDKNPECSETTMEYDYEDGHTWASYWPEVLAVFAVQNSLNNDGDVVVIDEGKKRLIQDTFWAMHEISAEVEEVITTPEPTEDEPDSEPVTEYILHITVSSKSVDALADLYRFTQDQRDILHQLLSEEMRPSLLALCGGIAIADGELC
ncbi:hypothetical protein [Gemmiger sp.]